MALFWFGIIVAIALGLIGVLADGMLYLLVIGVAVVIADLLLLGVRIGRRGRRPAR